MSEGAKARKRQFVRQLGPLRVAVVGSRQRTLDPFIERLRGQPFARLPAGQARELLADLTFLQQWRAALAIAGVIPVVFTVRKSATGNLRTALTAIAASPLAWLGCYAVFLGALWLAARSIDEEQKIGQVGWFMMTLTLAPWLCLPLAAGFLYGIFALHWT